MVMEVQTQKPEIQNQEDIKIEKKLRFVHETSNGWHAEVYISVVGETTVSGKLIRINKSDNMYIYSSDSVDTVISRISRVVKELEAETVNRIKNIKLIDEAIRRFTAENGIPFSVEIE